MSLFICLSLLGLASCANLVVDGSFEDAGSSSCPIERKWCQGLDSIFPWTKNPQFITNSWTASPEIAEVVTSNYHAASDGSYSMDLNEKSPYTLIQQVKGFVVGQTYKMSFLVSRNDHCDEGIVKSGFARVDGSGLDAGIQFSIPAGQSDWTPQSFTFVATDLSHAISIGSTTRDSKCGPMIDNVIVDTTTDTAPSATNLLQNGGFESAMTGCVGEDFCISSDAIIAPWKNAIAGDSIEVTSALRYQPASGQFSVDLNTDRPTKIYQEVQLEVGQTYTLTFSYSKNGKCDGDDKKGFVNILDAKADLSTMEGLYKQFVGTSEWKVSTMSFRAEFNTMRIAFGSLEEGKCGPALDSVSLVKVNALKRRNRW